MCGILVTKKAYAGSLAHRGIKSYQIPLDGITLVHEHLPIQSTISDYPIIETDYYIILYNGELFVDGYSNDLEYIEDLFSEMSFNIDSCIQELSKQDGFYSFIIIDKVEKTINCFTDPLGKKLLYISKDGIGSEIKSVIPDVVTLDNLYLSSSIKNGYTTGNRTCYNEVKRLLPNTHYIFDFDFDEWYHSEEIYQFGIKPAESLSSLMNKSVSNRLKGHEKVGLLLSGGLDSSIIYALIKQHNYDVNTYCVDNREDLDFARLLDPNVISISLEKDENALLVMEAPIDLGSMYPQYSLFSQVKETVVLTGDGADEIFGGYTRMGTYDAQHSDIFEELRFYHNPRIDKMSMYFTKEARSPFMSLDLVNYALNLPYSERINKKHLREIFTDILPSDIINRKKEPLKTNEILNSKGPEYRLDLTNKWKEQNGFKI